MNKINTKLTLIIILIFLLPIVNAVDYPQLTGFVTDNADIIDSKYEAKIIQLAEKIEKETTVEIAVVTIESLEGESKEMYAVHLFEQAGIGKKDKDNGLLILVAEQEREYRFEVGYGLEGTITDSMKVNIGDRIIVPNFKNGEYGKGIYESMLAVEELLEGNEEVISDSESQIEKKNLIKIFIFVGITIFLFFISDLSYYSKNKHRHQNKTIEIGRYSRAITAKRLGINHQPRTQYLEYLQYQVIKIRGILLGILLILWIISSIISQKHIPLLFVIFFVIVLILQVIIDTIKGMKSTDFKTYVKNYISNLLFKKFRISDDSGGYRRRSSGGGSFGGGRSGGGGFGGSW